MILQLTRMGFSLSRGDEALERLRSDFDRQHFVRFPGFLRKDLLDVVCREVERSDFYERTHAGIDDNKELCMRTQTTAGGLLHLLLNSEDLFDLISQITGCGPIGCFRGRVYRVVPRSGHRDAWHSDVARHRLVAMSINVSPAPYRGGTLQMRAGGSTRVLRNIPNPGFGDAILFRIDRGLEHRITDIEGSSAKTAFAGWFHTKPSFRSLMPGRFKKIATKAKKESASTRPAR